METSSYCGRPAWSEVDEQTRTSIYGRPELEILREADQPGVTSEVCSSLSPSESVSMAGGGPGELGGGAEADAQRKPRKDDPEARHKAEIDRMRAVIAEITAPGAKKKDEGWKIYR